MNLVKSGNIVDKKLLNIFHFKKPLVTVNCGDASYEEEVPDANLLEILTK